MNICMYYVMKFTGFAMKGGGLGWRLCSQVSSIVYVVIMERVYSVVVF